MEKPEDVNASCASPCSTASVLMVQLPFGADDWYQVPRRYDTIWISRRHPLPFYEAEWFSYFETVRDLLFAGF
jgi:hypothetical protein